MMTPHVLMQFRRRDNRYLATRWVVSPAAHKNPTPQYARLLTSNPTSSEPGPTCKSEKTNHSSISACASPSLLMSFIAMDPISFATAAVSFAVAVADRVSNEIVFLRRTDGNVPSTVVSTPASVSANAGEEITPVSFPTAAAEGDGAA